MSFGSSVSGEIQDERLRMEIKRQQAGANELKPRNRSEQQYHRWESRSSKGIVLLLSVSIVITLDNEAEQGVKDLSYGSDAHCPTKEVKSTRIFVGLVRVYRYTLSG
jgi:hypothetical protein